MKIKQMIFSLCIVYLHFNAINAEENSNFPRILWTFWDSGYQNAPLWTKICHNNMQHYAKLNNWEFRFLSNQTVNNYLSPKNQQRMKRQIQTSKWALGPTHRADLLRLYLLYEHGGIWMDANCGWINDLSWIDKLDQQIDIKINNKMGTSPDVLAFSRDNFINNNTQAFDKKYQIQVYFFPGIQVWFIIAKKGALILKDILDNVEYELGQTPEDLTKQYNKKGIAYGRMIEPYFITCNVQFHTILQIKQRQIHANPQKYNASYAVEYYKIWTIRCQESIFLLIYEAQWDPNRLFSLMLQTRQYLTKKYQFTPIFLKFTGKLYWRISEKIVQLARTKCQQHGNDQVKELSLMYQHFLKYSLDIYQVSRINDCLAKQPVVFKDPPKLNINEIEYKCQSRQSVKTIFFQIFVLKFVGLFGAIILFIYISLATPKAQIISIKGL